MMLNLKLIFMKNNNIFYSQNQLFPFLQTLLLCLKLYAKLECGKFRNCIMSNPCLVRNSCFAYQHD